MTAGMSIINPGSWIILMSPNGLSPDLIVAGDNMNDMLMLKMNHGYLDYYRSRNMWEQTGTAYLRGIGEIGREAGKHGMIHLAQMVNPYAFLPTFGPA